MSRQERIINALELSHPIASRNFLKKNGYTRFLYKFYGLQPSLSKTKERISQVLIESKIWLSSTEDFNDPFDSRIRVFAGGGKPEQRQHLLKIFNEMKPANGEPSPTESEINKRIDEIISSGNISNIFHDAYERSIKKAGICCFASAPMNHKNILMWSHYASSHKGICVVFNVSQGAGVFLNAFPVEYSDTFPSIDKINDPPGDMLKKGLLRKFSAWSYEAERRIYKPNSARSTLDFPAKAIAAVILGAESSQDLQEVVASVILERTSRGLPGIPLYKARKDDRKYLVKAFRI